MSLVRGFSSREAIESLVRIPRRRYIKYGKESMRKDLMNIKLFRETSIKCKNGIK